MLRNQIMYFTLVHVFTEKTRTVLRVVLLLVTNPLYSQIYIQSCSAASAVDARSA